MSGDAGYRPPPEARAAASLLLLRDGAEGLEVLMLRRAERQGDVRSGAVVFPGGIVESRDREAHGQVLGPGDAELSRRFAVAEGALDYAVAALRETFEEVGLLLAEGVADFAALGPWRLKLHAGEVGAAGFCAAAGIRLDARELVYFAHWLTPPGSPKRFDTRFFAAPAPAGQQAVADGTETMELMWLAPRQALERGRGLKLLPVTREILRSLSAHADAATALAALRALPEVPLTMPRRALTPRGPDVVLPWEYAWAEIGRIDPEGRGDAHADIVPGRVVRLSERLLRITAPNPGVMTGPGTNTYLVGGPERWTVIDPGPEDSQHLQALLAAAAPGRIERILVTHTHRDHSPGAAGLAAATGAPVWGMRTAHAQWQDATFAPAHEPADGERINAGEDAWLRVIHTPGHAGNHLCYLLEAEKLLFTGDHVMQGSTVVINPPDGDMAAYLGSLESLLAEDLEWLAPGHGFLVAQPQAVIRALIAHRLKREAKVLEALREAGRGPVEALLPRVYADVPAAIHGVAARSLLAHLLKLEGEGRARRDQVGDGEAWSAV